VHISELHSVEGHSKIPINLQHERFFFIHSTHRRLCACRNLGVGQYVAQCCLNRHQPESHSCKENKQNNNQELRKAGVFAISLI